jgi:hypothetical protein
MTKLPRYAQLVSLYFCLTLCLMTKSFADPAVFANGKLLVPRIDIDGMGAMAAEFQATAGASNETFIVLTKLAPSVPGKTSAGLFNNSAGTLELFDLTTPDGAHYFVVFQYQPDGNVVRFKLTEVLPLPGPAGGQNPSPGTGGSSGSPAEHSAQRIEFNSKCASCHGENGLGTASAPALIGCATCKSQASLESYIDLTMPLGQAHLCDALCAKELASYIINSLNGKSPADLVRAIDGLTTVSSTQALRKASMQLAGRLPTATETAMVRTNSQQGLATALTLMMNEPAFYQRVAEIFNLYLLTDKYLTKNEHEGAIRLLDRDDYPNYRWFDDGKREKDDQFYYLRDTTNDAIAREPLELIKHVVRNNRPLSEILTANYLMVNSFSARSYGVSGLVFKNPDDPTEFVEGKISGIPHAGIMTSSMFLNRYPTTYTNRNRGRARVVFDFFLDTNILAIEGTRPGNAVDLVNAVPTIDNPDCSKCHSVLDPVASTFQNWDERGSFRPARLARQGWFPDMEPRGFAGKVMPLAGNVDSSLQWLAKQIAVDPRFPRAMVRIMVRGLTGKEPLPTPGENASILDISAYQAERKLLSQIEQRFVSDNMNLKTLVREIILSPYWQAAGLSNVAESPLHKSTGAVSLLGPEQLNGKLSALFGFDWRGTLNSFHHTIKNDWDARLLNRNYFQQIYGGIDSDSVAKPLTSPNGLMGAVQLRLANEMACYAVPNEFLYQKLGQTNKVRLFPYVTQNLSPYDASGKFDAANVKLIKQNIQHLHQYLLGEELAADDPELAYTEQLFINVLDYGRATIAASNKRWEVTYLPWSCARHSDITTGEDIKDATGKKIEISEDSTYLVRSWMAVVAYLLADYRFFYE